MHPANTNTEHWITQHSPTSPACDLHPRHHVVLDEPPDGLAVCWHDELPVCMDDVVALSAAHVVLQDSPSPKDSCVRAEQGRHGMAGGETQGGRGEVEAALYDGLWEALCDDSWEAPTEKFCGTMCTPSNADTKHPRQAVHLVQSRPLCTQVYALLDRQTFSQSPVCVAPGRRARIQIHTRTCGRCRLISSPSKSALNEEQLA